MLVQNEERGQAGEDRFQGEKDGGVGGGGVLLGPALDGKGGCGGEEAGNGQSDEETRGDGQVRSSTQWQGDGHDERCYADLQGRELSGGDSARGVGEGE